MTPPHGLSEIIAYYGDISIDAASEQVITPPHWESWNIVVVDDLPGWPHRLRLNGKVLEPLRLALGRCIDLHDGYVIHALGCFCPRYKRGNSGEISVHSWAAAVDINADTNPRGFPMAKDIPNSWVDIFEGCGFTWGGDFPTPDPMHMQWASGY